MSQNNKSYYQRYIDGDCFTNEDLKKAIKELTPVEATLRNYGPSFKFAWRAIYDTLEGLKGYQTARKTK